MTPPMNIHQIHAHQTVAHERVTEAIRGTAAQKANSGPLIAEADRWDNAATQARNLRKQLTDDMLFTVDDMGNVSLASTMDAATVAAWMDARVAAYVEGKEDEVVDHFSDAWDSIKHNILGLHVDGYGE